MGIKKTDVQVFYLGNAEENNNNIDNDNTTNKDAIAATVYYDLNYLSLQLNTTLVNGDVIEVEVWFLAGLHNSGLYHAKTRIKGMEQRQPTLVPHP